MRKRAKRAAAVLMAAALTAGSAAMPAFAAGLPAWLTGETEEEKAETAAAPETAPAQTEAAPALETAPAQTEAAPAPAVVPVPAPVPVQPAAPEAPSEEERAAAAAYLAKYQELVSWYGEAAIQNGDTAYLTGVCGLGFLDLDGNGVQDMLTVIWNGSLSGSNNEPNDIPLGNDYRIDVWTYAEDQVNSLFAYEQVGNYQSFSTEFWDADLCLLEAVEKADGKTVLRLVQDEREKGVFQLYEIYQENGSFYQDSYFFADGALQRNGSAISEEEWKEALKIKAILYAANFSDDDMEFSAGVRLADEADFDGYGSYNGQDLAWVLLNLRENEKALAEGRIPARRAEAEYIAPYREAIDLLDRENHLDGDPGESFFQLHNYQYSLYDLDSNGVPELIVKEYSSEAGAFYNIYSVQNGQLVYCGQDAGAHTEVTVSGGEGAAILQSHMGWYQYRYWTLPSYQLQVTVSEDREGSIDDFEDWHEIYDPAYPISLGAADPADPVLLYRYALDGVSWLDEEKHGEWLAHKGEWVKGAVTGETAYEPVYEPAGENYLTVVGGIQAPASDFLFPESSQRSLTWEEMDAMLWYDDPGLRHDYSQLAINEIFARYGFTFGTSSSSALLAHDTFEACPWYQEAKAACPNDDWYDLYYNYLSDVERGNVELINDWQEANGVYY